MEDLSSKLPGGPITALAPTSQSGGNMQSSNRLAHTAPGSEPVDPLPDRSEQGDPAIEATAYDTPVRLDAGGAKVTPDANTARPSLFTTDAGAGWMVTGPNRRGPEGTADALRASNPDRGR